jgi:hypothetical protein
VSSNECGHKWQCIQRRAVNAFGAFDGIAWCETCGALLELRVMDGMDGEKVITWGKLQHCGNALLNL